MQPENDDWQQPQESTVGELHAYVAPKSQPVDATLDDASPMSSDETEGSKESSVREGEEEAVRWQASEYIQRDKTPMWYAGFGLIAIVLVLAALFLMKSVTFALLIPVMAAALFVVNLRRPPALYDYTLSRQGLHINDRLYPFKDFKEFGLVKDDDQHSIMLIPRKRLSLGVTVYFPEEAGEAIVDMLAARLPMHEVTLDPIDRLIRFLRI